MVVPLLTRLSRLSMTDFIESLGDCIPSAGNAAFRLRDSLNRIDQAVSLAVLRDSLTPHQSQQGSQGSPPGGDIQGGSQSVTAAVNDFETSSLLPLSRRESPFPGFIHRSEYEVE